MEKSRAGRTFGSYGGFARQDFGPQMFFRTQIGPKFFSNSFLFEKNSLPRKWQELAVLVDMCWSSSLFSLGGQVWVFLNLKAFFLGIQKQQEAAVITQMYIDTFP